MKRYSSFCVSICLGAVFAIQGAETKRQVRERLDKALAGCWKLQGDCKDSSKYKNNGINHGVIFEKTSAGLAARFDGKNAFIEIHDSGPLNPGTNDFSISVWVKCDPFVLGTPGDIVNKYDPELRNGINLNISASSPGYSSSSDVRNVQFGIDNAAEGEWIDCGRPWKNNTLISTLIVYRGKLYTGIAAASDPNDACHMFRYGGGKKWIDCGRVGSDLKTPSVYSVIVHNGLLYAGTGVWDWEQVWTGNSGPTHVYRYEGGTNWHDCGQFGAGYRILSLASYDGNLYASDDKGFQFRYDGDNNWKLCGDVNKDQAQKNKKIYSLTVWGGKLFGGSSVTAHRFEGAAKWDTVALFDAKVINQIHTLEGYKGKLFAGTWPEGKVVMYEADQRWKDCGNMGIDTVKQQINEINDLTVYNGKLYAGALPKGEVWRYDGDTNWTRIKQLVENPDWDAKKLTSWDRVPCLTVYEGKLFAGTSTCHGRAEAEPKTAAGKVFSWEAGTCVSFDGDIGPVWKHVVAAKKGKRLDLYIDGQRASSSSEFDPSKYNLMNKKPLLIGFGAKSYFAGCMRDLRIYNRALSEEEILAVSRN
jgi:hypothetical protein